MPRARNIKPSFFKNEDLPLIPAIGRLLFIGLWTLADREGRLEDRPRKIKGELFPYEECDVESNLDLLVKYGFILRYEVHGNRYIKILKFKDHQNPHHTEKASLIPSETIVNTGTPDINGGTPDINESTCVEIPLIPDSRILIPDSLNPDSYAKGFKNSGRRFDIDHLLSDNDRDKARDAVLPYGWDLHELIREYNDGVNNGRRDPPDKPGIAFIGWCKKYTKGKRI